MIYIYFFSQTIKICTFKNWCFFFQVHNYLISVLLDASYTQLLVLSSLTQKSDFQSSQLATLPEMPPLQFYAQS